MCPADTPALAARESAATECGYYDFATNGFAGETVPGTGTSYTEQQCLIASNLIQVTLATTYPIPVPILSAIWPNGLTIQTSATMMEEQGTNS